jgi:hypothetical protein
VLFVLPTFTSSRLPGAISIMPQRRQALGAQLRRLKEQILEFDRMIRAWHRSCETSLRLEDCPGIGPVLATALAAAVADPKAVVFSASALPVYLPDIARYASFHAIAGRPSWGPPAKLPQALLGCRSCRSSCSTERRLRHRGNKTQVAA